MEEKLRAKEKAMSLLPVGVAKVSGNFIKGDIVEIKNAQGKELGFGIVQYDAARAREIVGKKNMKPMVHYNYMFVNA